MTDGLEWLPVRVGSAALGIYTWATDANVLSVQSEGSVFPIGPHGDIPSGIVPLSAHSGGKSSITLTKIFLELVVVGGASDVSVQVNGPSVFSYISVPFGVESGDSVVAFDTFVASSEFFTERIDSVLGWSSAAGNSVVSWEAMASVVLKSLGNGSTVPY